MYTLLNHDAYTYSIDIFSKNWRITTQVSFDFRAFHVWNKSKFEIGFQFDFPLIFSKVLVEIVVYRTCPAISFNYSTTAAQNPPRAQWLKTCIKKAAAAGIAVHRSVPKLYWTFLTAKTRRPVNPPCRTRTNRMPSSRGGSHCGHAVPWVRRESLRPPLPRVAPPLGVAVATERTRYAHCIRLVYRPGWTFYRRFGVRFRRRDRSTKRGARSLPPPLIIPNFKIPVMWHGRIWFDSTAQVRNFLCSY